MIKKFSLSRVRLSLLLVTFLFSEKARAEVTPLLSPTPKTGTLFDFIVVVLGIVIKISIPILTVFIIYTGYLFVTAAGDEGKISKAREMSLWTVVGAAIVLGAVALARMVGGTVNGIVS